MTTLNANYFVVYAFKLNGNNEKVIPGIVHWVKESFHTDLQIISGSLYFKRCMDTDTVIGYTKEGAAATFITIITNAGEVKTAFPGKYEV